jgi:hypothetical protein
MRVFISFIRTELLLKTFEFPNAEMLVPFLWKEGQDHDSDGEEDGEDKLYQYMQNREREDEVVVVERVQKGPGGNLYEISSDLEHIVARAAYFLAMVMEGQVGSAKDGPFTAPDGLLAKLGKDFDLEAAFQRVKESRQWKGDGTWGKGKW